MQFKLTHSLPEKCIVAVSGGVDSLSALHFLNRVQDRVKRVIHINHATGNFAQESEELVRQICDQQKIDLTIRTIREHRGEGESRENHWREQRYRFFWDENSLYSLPIVLAHNMDDCLENYISSTMIAGRLGTIPYSHGPCIRPFRLWKRKEIEEYAKKNAIVWVEDPSNRDYIKYQRSFIRMYVVPRIRKLNPGIYNVVEKAITYQDQYDNRENNSSYTEENKANKS